MRTRDENKSIQLKKLAIEMIAKKGLEGFGINKLAKAAGLSSGTIYLYFKDKDELLRTLCLEVGLSIQEACLKGLSPETPFNEGMKILWLNRFRYAMEFPEKMAFMEKIRYTDSFHQDGDETSKIYDKITSEFLDSAIKRGELAQMPVELFLSLAFAPLYQLINFIRQKGKDQQTSSLTESLVCSALERVLKGLRP